MNKEEFRQHYEEFSTSYDDLRDNRNLTTKINAKRQINFVLSQFKGINSITEVGCGTGKFTVPLALAGKKIRAYDYSKEMIKLAKKKAIKYGVQDNIEFNHGNIENLPIKSNSSEGVLSIAVIRHLLDQSKAIEELARILSPNGVMICDYMSTYYFSIYDLVKTIFGKNTNTKGNEWFINYYRSYNEMKMELGDLGLTIINKKQFILLPTRMTEILKMSRVVNYLEDLTGLGGIVYLTSRKKS